MEDNPANQKLANYILQDRGHLVDIAGDGQEAVYLTEENRYDVILMDVQMPGMNGLEATASIRKREGGGGRVPIIAMTAHAMRGDREQCLAAGMDGYLAKPINGDEMIVLVETLAARSPAVALAPEAMVFDPQLARSRCSGSQDMVREMIQCFFADADTLLPQMRLALEKGDLMEVGRLGHRMKGTVVYLGARLAEEAALGVEQLGGSNAGSSSEVEEAVNALQREYLALKAVLAGRALVVEPKQGN